MVLVSARNLSSVMALRWRLPARRSRGRGPVAARPRARLPADRREAVRPAARPEGVGRRHRSSSTTTARNARARCRRVARPCRTAGRSCTPSTGAGRRVRGQARQVWEHRSTEPGGEPHLRRVPRRRRSHRRRPLPHLPRRRGRFRHRRALLRPDAGGGPGHRRHGPRHPPAGRRGFFGWRSYRAEHLDSWYPRGAAAGSAQRPSPLALSGVRRCGTSAARGPRPLPSR